MGGKKEEKKRGGKKKSYASQHCLEDSYINFTALSQYGFADIL